MNTDPQESKRLIAAAYLRVSTKAQAADDRFSIPVQREACREKAADIGVDLPDELIFEEYYSGEDILWRDTAYMSKVVPAAAQHRFQVLIVWDLERFSRGGGSYGISAIRLLEDAGVTLRTVKVDLNDLPDDFPFKTTFRAMQLDAAAWDNRKRALKSWESKRSIRASNRLVAGRLKYGYNWRYGDQLDSRSRYPKQGMDPDEDVLEQGHKGTAPIVRRMFEQVASGASLLQVCRSIIADGIEPPSWRVVHNTEGTGRAAGWWPATLQKMVRDPIYWGEGYAFVTKRVLRDKTVRELKGYKTRKKKESRPLDERIPIPTDVVPPLVSKELAMRALAQLNVGRQDSPRNTRHFTAEDVLLYRLIRCAYCGNVLGPCRRSEKASRGGPRIWTYHCAHVGRPPKGCPRGVSINAREVDEYVWNEVCRAIRDEDYLQSLIVRTERASVTSPANMVKHYERLLADAEKHRSNLQKQIAQYNEDDPDEAEAAASLRHDITVYSKQVREHREQLETARAILEADAQREATVKQFAQWAHERSAKLDLLTAEERRKILKALHTTVTIGSEHAPTTEDGEYIPRISVSIDVSSNPETASRIPADRRQHNVFYTKSWKTKYFEVRDGTPPVPSWQPNPDNPDDPNDGLIDLTPKPWEEEFEDEEDEAAARAKGQTDNSSLA